MSPGLRSACGAAVLVLVAACGTEPTVEVGDAAAHGVYDDGSSDEVPLAACSGGLVNWAGGEFAFSGRPVAVGAPVEIAEEPYSLLPAMGTPVTFEEVEVLFDETGDLEGSDVELFAVHALLPEGRPRLPMLTIDLDALFGQELVTVVGRAVPDDFGFGPLLTGAVALDDGETSFLGSCQFLARPADTAAGHLRFDSGFDFVTAWQRSKTFGEEARYRSAVGEAENPNTQLTDRVYRWEENSPKGRSLQPADVPPEIASDLDVRGFFVDLREVPSDSVVAVRTDTGVSGGVAPSVDAVVIPLYFTTTDRVVEVVVGPPGNLVAAEVWASIDIEEVKDGGGVAVTGTYPDEISVDVVSEVELADLIGVSGEGLDELREAYLRVDGG